jgi:UPF0271 protein
MSRPTPTIDLNADLGEGCANDEAILALVTSASVSCGVHAGDPETILRTLIEARSRGVVVGAHPGYDDREGFGRRERSLNAEQIERLILDQLDTFASLASRVGLAARFVKPHGALYNQAQRQHEAARGVVAAVVRLELPLIGQPGSLLQIVAGEAGVSFISEGFPDRRYRADGGLVARSEPDAVLVDPGEVESQVIRLVEQGVATLCIHGDDPRAVQNAEIVRTVLRRHGIVPKGFT